MNFFSIDSKFFRFMSKVADCMLLSILWFVFSIPVVTAGAATASLYYCVNKVLREDQGSTVKSFWHSFKSNLKQGTIVTLLFAALSLLVTAIGSAVYARTQTEDVLANIYLVYLVLSIFGIAWLHYILSYTAKFQNSISTVLKNSLIICIANLPQSAVIAIFFVVVIILMVLLMPRALGAMLFVPAVYMLLVSFLLEKVYKKYMPPEKKPEYAVNT